MFSSCGGEHLHWLLGLYSGDGSERFLVIRRSLDLQVRLTRGIHKMANLFDSTVINGLEIPNRFVRSATWEGMNTAKTRASRQMISTLTNLSGGGVGLIFSGHAYVSPEGQATPYQVSASSDKDLKSLQEVAAVVHDEGGKILLQISHAGAFSRCDLSAMEAIGPSVIQGAEGPIGKQMSYTDIRRIVRAFALAALRAQSAGYDGIQIHGAHGYLVSQFLSPVLNKRQDEYGGTVLNRARFAVEIVRAVRMAVGLSFPILIKVNSDDYLPGGLTAEEMIEISALLAQAGCDAIEMSGGTMLSGKKVGCRPGRQEPGEPEAYYERAARMFKAKLAVPLMLVGGIRTFETAERLIQEQTADYIALCRPLIREPGLVNRWRAGDRSPSLCISCNGCARSAFSGKGMRCTALARSMNKSFPDKPGEPQQIRPSMS
jgi:2,4-dienoyl-CoA reductase-like NADH-dependent reductase (Old Yellow Enzyme family)